MSQSSNNGSHMQVTDSARSMYSGANRTQAVLDRARGPLLVAGTGWIGVAVGQVAQLLGAPLPVSPELVGGVALGAAIEHVYRPLSAVSRALTRAMDR